MHWHPLSWLSFVLGYYLQRDMTYWKRFLLGELSGALRLELGLWDMIRRA